MASAALSSQRGMAEFVQVSPRAGAVQRGVLVQQGAGLAVGQAGQAGVGTDLAGADDLAGARTSVG